MGDIKIKKLELAVVVFHRIILWALIFLKFCEKVMVMGATSEVEFQINKDSV